MRKTARNKTDPQPNKGDPTWILREPDNPKDPTAFNFEQQSVGGVGRWGMPFERTAHVRHRKLVRYQTAESNRLAVQFKEYFRVELPVVIAQTRLSTTRYKSNKGLFLGAGWANRDDGAPPKVVNPRSAGQSARNNTTAADTTIVHRKQRVFRGEPRASEGATPIRRDGNAWSR